MALGCPVRLSNSCSFSLSCSATSSTFSSARMAAISFASLLSLACGHPLMSWPSQQDTNCILATAAGFHAACGHQPADSDERFTSRRPHPCARQGDSLAVALCHPLTVDPQ